MCGICGCGQASVVAPEGEHEHTDEHGHVFRHAHLDDHDHRHDLADDQDHDHDRDVGHSHQARVVKVERDILEKNDRIAAQNRLRFATTRTLALNLVSSPGAGKTSLLVRTLGDLRNVRPIAVIEGDQQTSLDADRIRKTGAPAVQINTGKMCHLDASMIEDALASLPAPAGGVLFVENVGNLVCPAGFDLGEACKVALVSVTEGEDKPLKYPDMFHAAGLVLVTKIDLLPHLDFDVDLLVENAQKVHPGVPVLRVSARTGEGLDAWYAWIDARANEITRAA